MRQIQHIMGMPVIVEIAESVRSSAFTPIFDYFHWVDNTFSTYKEDSEVSLINAGKLKPKDASQQVQLIFRLCEQTKTQTDGYFDINHDGHLDPSGLVKGWAIHNASLLLAKHGFKNYYVEASGDIEVAGHNPDGNPWIIGIKNPFNTKDLVKVVRLKNQGIATSGNYERGLHIYNPKSRKPADEIKSLTVIGPNVYEADRFATASFVMGESGINFIEKKSGLEGYMIDKKGIATFTSSFENFVANNRT